MNRFDVEGRGEVEAKFPRGGGGGGVGETGEGGSFGSDRESGSGDGVGL